MMLHALSRSWTLRAGAAALATFLALDAHAQPCGPVTPWTLTATLPSQVPPRLSTAIVGETTRNRVVLFGGLAPFPVGALDDTWVYDGNGWTLAASGGPPARTGHRLAFDSQRNRTVLYGGVTSAGLAEDTWEWDGTTWTPGPSSTFVPRTGFALAYGGNGRTVLFGGTGLVDDVPVTFDETYVYDGTAWTLLSTVGSPPASEFAAMAIDPLRQRVVLFGGNDLDFNLISETWELDLNANPPTWTRFIAPGPSGRSFASMAFDASRSAVVLTGGSADSGRSLETWAFDGTAWTLISSALPTLGGQDALSPIASFQPSTGAGGVVLAGWGPTTTYRLGAGGTWTQTQTPVIPALRDYALAFDPSLGGRTLLFGGANLVNGPVGATWSFNGTAWSVLSTSGPAGREFSAMAFDTLRSRAVLFGGLAEDGSRGDTWAFAGGNWTQVVGTGPSPRRGHAMAYDPSRDRVVLYGGTTEDGPQGDTWVLNGNTWSQVVTGASPGPRDRAVATYDPARQRVVLFGGRNDNFEPQGDLWSFDGTNWTRETASGPSPRTVAAMSFDAAANRLVLFGGQNAEGIALNDTWTQVAGSWTRLDAQGPAGLSVDGTGRLGVKSVFDSARGRSTLFGGFDGATTLGDTWSLAQPTNIPATVTGHPVGGLVFVGGSIALSASATSVRPTINYRWRRNGEPISDGPSSSGSVYAGTSTPALTISSVGFNDAARYDLVVTTDCGTVFSGEASILVDFCPADINRDGSATVGDLFEYLNLWFAGCDGSSGDAPCFGRSADLNFDGVDVQDIFAFLNIWFAGC